MAYSNALAIGVGNLIYGKPIATPNKSLTQTYIEDALEMARDYHRYNMLSATELVETEEKINSATSDDEISGIMCRLRHKAYGI